MDLAFDMCHLEHAATDCPKKWEASEVMQVAAKHLKKGGVVAKTPRASEHLSSMLSRDPLPLDVDSKAPWKDFISKHDIVPRVWVPAEEVWLSAEAGRLGQRLLFQPHTVTFEGVVTRTLLFCRVFCVSGQGFRFRWCRTPLVEMVKFLEQQLQLSKDDQDVQRVIRLYALGRFPAAVTSPWQLLSSKQL